ncbi:long-chain fatty acid--CoA ligase [Saccharolobus caldissimus]|uniref:AMP-dependent synthetase n=1 Tax=Saccharolobus caldissimus TaxID=1702097 RepID=A0AAQ4CSE6_9CREN|nr:long-chain fatty acid--CoA ligase [Saccharolobus caldissimus]BDB98727.1 AMP-dependent synthetase [Saccharolobus caldissimus]
MDSTIMDYNLNIKSIFWRVEKLYKDKEIISRTHEGIKRYTYGDFALRVRKLARMLESKNLVRSRVASIAWNTHRHLELYFAVPLLGGILHTVNVRFHKTEMDYVITEMDDKAVFTDKDIEYKSDKIPVYIFDEKYDDEIESQEPIKDFPDIDERQGAIACFTSGTTGKPKGVIYSHRSIFIHSLSLLAQDVLGISSSDVVLPIVPMFHISAWDLPFASLMTGAKLVLPGPRPKAEDIVNLIKDYKVTIGIAAPTVWIDVVAYVEREKLDLSPLKVVVTGGAEPPLGLIKKLREYGVKTYHAWGMTETEAIATINKSDDINKMSEQGYPIFGFEISLVDAEGKELPWDGKSAGELVVRGAFVTKKYFNNPSNILLNNTWFKTGDVVKIYPDGSIKVVDRLKDLIKSGGEWISSVDLENAIMSYDKVLEAVVVGIPDEKWGERPIALVVKKPGKEVSAEEIIDYLKSLNRFPKWWLPDKIIFVDSIPKTSTGKLDKKVIRDMVKSMLNLR